MAYKRTIDKPSEVTLNVTPMLDMAFQLMFFFLATFNPSSIKEGQMELSLPSKSEPRATDPANVNPISEAQKEDVDIPSDFTISIRGYKDEQNRGEINALIVQTTSGEEEIKGKGNDNKKQREDRDIQLRERLSNVKVNDKPDKDGKVKVPTVRMAAESAIRWDNVMQIMDVCYKAGFQVSFAKPPDLGSSSP